MPDEIDCVRSLPRQGCPLPLGWGWKGPRCTEPVGQIRGSSSSSGVLGWTVVVCKCCRHQGNIDVINCVCILPRQGLLQSATTRAAKRSRSREPEHLVSGGSSSSSVAGCDSKRCDRLAVLGDCRQYLPRSGVCSCEGPKVPQATETGVIKHRSSSSSSCISASGRQMKDVVNNGRIQLGLVDCRVTFSHNVLAVHIPSLQAGFLASQY